MKRTAIRQPSPLRMDDGKAVTSVKPKRKTCKACKEKFTTTRPMQCACSIECAQQIAQVERAKAEKREAAKERAATRERRAELKPRSKWLAEAQASVNRYCRLRDQARGLGCFTCGAKPAAAFGGTLDAGHFRSVGSAPHLRYFTSQIKTQCIPCNRHKGGMALEFRRQLVAERGAEWVDDLEAMQGTAKFTVEFLQRLKRIFNKKANRQERRNALLRG